MKRKLNNQGQALLETLLTIVFITIVCFAAMEVSLMVANDLIANESTYALARTMAVKYDKVESFEIKQSVAAVLLLGLHANISFAPYSLVVNEAEVKARNFDGTDFKRYEAVMSYGNLLSFSSLIKPGPVIEGKSLITRNSRVRFVKSPNKEFYYKAFNGASKFDK